MRDDSQSNGKIKYQSISRNERGQYRQSGSQEFRGSQQRNNSSHKVRQAKPASPEFEEDYDTITDFDQEPVRTENRRSNASRQTGQQKHTANRSQTSSNHTKTNKSGQHSSSHHHTSGHSGSHSSGHASGHKHSSGSRHGKKGLKKDVLAWILLGLQAALSICLIVVLLILNVLPLKLLIPVIVIVAVLWVAIFITQLKRYKKLPLIGKIISILLCIILAIGNYYLIITNKAIETVSEDTVYNYTYLDVVVLKDDPAETIKDAKDYTFGIQATYQPLNLKTAIDEIENDVGKSIATKDYDTVMNQIDALYSRQVPAVIYNRNFKTTIESVHETFEDDVKVIKTITIKDSIDISSNSKVDVTAEPFLFYISGNDEYGEVTFEGRSDVNILVAVNPNSREILMITTPRDYYVVLPGVSNGTRDKLTHAGVYGMQCQLDTFQELYGYEVDYYCRVNFDSLIEIVDAIGGVDVYNELEFEFTGSDGLIIPQGYVHLDGYSALCFCRERHSFEDGDAARARHQQQVIESIINKLLSSTGFSAYSQLIKTLEKYCVTNMPKESISALVKKQLSEGGGWNITKVAAEGEAFLQPTFSMGSMPLYVVMPYVQSLANINTMLGQVYRGEPVTELYLDENSDYSLVDQPVPVETSEEDEDGYTVVRSDLVDVNGNVFGQMVKHIDEEDDDRVVRTEYFDLNGNKLSADEVEARKKGTSAEDETTTDEDNEDETTTIDEDGGEEDGGEENGGEEGGGEEGGDNSDEGDEG